MEENIQKKETQETQTPSMESIQAPSVTPNYATFWQRLGAALIDAIIVSTVLGVIFGSTSYSVGTLDVSYSGWIPSALGATYYVLMITKFGATLGKMTLKIKVRNVTSGNNPSFIEALLRETLGKLISAVAILVGYFWMLWDPEKQTWHDKMAKTIVVKA